MKDSFRFVIATKSYSPKPWTVLVNWIEFVFMKKQISNMTMEAADRASRHDPEKAMQGDSRRKRERAGESDAAGGAWIISVPELRDENLEGAHGRQPNLGAEPATTGRGGMGPPSPAPGSSSSTPRATWFGMEMRALPLPPRLGLSPMTQLGARHRRGRAHGGDSEACSALLNCCDIVRAWNPNFPPLSVSQSLSVRLSCSVSLSLAVCRWFFATIIALPNSIDVWMAAMVGGVAVIHTLTSLSWSHPVRSFLECTLSPFVWVWVCVCLLDVVHYVQMHLYTHWICISFSTTMVLLFLHPMSKYLKPRHSLERTTSSAKKVMQS